MVEDIFSLLRLPERFISDQDSSASDIIFQPSSTADSELEMMSRRGFVPLMPFFPWDAEEQGWTVPFSDRDSELQASGALRTHDPTRPTANP